MQGWGVIKFCLNIFLCSGGFGHWKENWGQIGEDYHLQRLNAQSDSSVIKRGHGAHFQFSFPATHRIVAAFSSITFRGIELRLSILRLEALYGLASQLGFVSLEDRECRLPSDSFIFLGAGSKEFTSYRLFVPCLSFQEADRPVLEQGLNYSSHIMQYRFIWGNLAGRASLEEACCFSSFSSWLNLQLKRASAERCIWW